MKKGLLIKIEYIKGLNEFVTTEVNQLDLGIIEIEKEGVMYLRLELPFTRETFEKARSMRSVNNVYLTMIDSNLTPQMLKGNLNILSDLVDKVGVDGFSTFDFDCSERNSPETYEITKYLARKYNLKGDRDADLQLHYGRRDGTWELSVRLIRRPLSLRDWKVENIKGGMNPTIAYCMNLLTKPDPSDRYLNIFSGAGTLLIERALMGEADELIGFDSNGESNGLAMRNIRKAKLSKRIKVVTENIFTSPELGKFDVITANLPFGIQLNSETNLKSLYSHFIDYSKSVLKKEGRMVIYTSRMDLLELAIEGKKVQIIEQYNLEVRTSRDTILETVVCKMKVDPVTPAKPVEKLNSN